MNLYDETLYLLKNRPKWLNYRQIAKAIGVSVPWLKNFAIGGGENSSVKKVQKLNDYLKVIEG